MAPRITEVDMPTSSTSPNVEEGPVVVHDDGPAFGHQLKEQYFLLAPTLTNFNHASFGAMSRPVAEAQQKYRLEQEARPDRWFRETYFEKLDAARAALATLIHCDVQDLVLVENASAAVNSILRSGLLVEGDTVLVFSTAYKMVTHTLEWLQTQIGVRTIVVAVPFPLVDTGVLVQAVDQALAQATSEGRRVRLCVFSHISSMPAIIEPVKPLTKLAHEAGALVLVDGAHAPGQIDIDVTDIGCDFYCGNAHKWLFAPKGSAFLYVSRALQTSTFPEPTAISSSGRFDFLGRYAYTGTRDYTAFASLPAALDFVDLLGLHRVRQYNRSLALEGGQLCAVAWNTQLLVAPDACAFMVNVILPSKDMKAVQAMQHALDTDHDVYIVCDSVPGVDGELILFTRLSAQVYLELSDFQRLASLVLHYLTP